MGKRKDLSNNEKGQLVMPRQLRQSISKTGCSWYVVVSTVGTNYCIPGAPCSWYTEVTWYVNLWSLKSFLMLIDRFLLCLIFHYYYYYYCLFLSRTSSIPLKNLGLFKIVSNILLARTALFRGSCQATQWVVQIFGPRCVVLLSSSEGGRPDLNTIGNNQYYYYKTVVVKSH